MLGARRIAGTRADTPCGTGADRVKGLTSVATEPGIAPAATVPGANHKLTIFCKTVWVLRWLPTISIPSRIRSSRTRPAPHYPSTGHAPRRSSRHGRV